MLNLEEVSVFLAVARVESFARAAEQLEMPTSTASRRIASLEDYLGVQLFQRTTRSVKLSEVGQAFLPRARRLVEDAAEVEQTIQSLRGEPQGLLRVTAPVLFAQRVLPSIITRFLRLYPKVRVDLVSTDRVVDLVSEGFDVAIRPFPREDSGLIARKLGVGRMVLCASPAYLAEHPMPQRPEDLRDHVCIMLDLADDSSLWTLGGVEVRIDGPVRVNDPEIALEFARQGLGVAMLLEFGAHSLLRQGQLLRLLEDYPTGERVLAAVYPSSRHLSLKVRAFVDELAEALDELKGEIEAPFS